MRKVIMLLLLIGLAAAVAWWQLAYPQADEGRLQLYGNVDIRQVSLAFTLSERLAEVNAEEGDRVAAGQPLARLDTRSLALKRRRAGRRWPRRNSSWRG